MLVGREGLRAVASRAPCNGSPAAACDQQWQEQDSLASFGWDLLLALKIALRMLGDSCWCMRK